jgi:FkbM family methyltransferase
VNEKLYKKVEELNWQPKHVCEVGVYYPETSNILGFIEDGCLTDLVEADPKCIKEIRDRFQNYQNVRIHPFAICDQPGEVELYRFESSTFVRGLKTSPALVNDNYQPDPNDLFRAEARLFSDIDDGTINLISIDIEGSEWFVIKYMKSRPDVISVELGSPRKRYRNAHEKEILDWLKENNYRKWYRDGTDTVYVSPIIETPFWSRWF